MRTRTIVGIGVIVLLCLASFLAGRVSASRGVATYLVRGVPTSFNRAWPTYGLPLAEDEALLVLLRNGEPTNAIPSLEALLDTAAYDAMCRRPLLRGQELEVVDKVLAKVARYRQQFPRAIDTSTNGFGDSQQVQQYEAWGEQQRRVDDFLRGFVKK